MKEFLSIKEFSKLSGIETTTLRYWDDIGLFSPAKRNPENNYRYYSPEQIIAVNFITVLKHLDISLKTIEGMGDNRTPESILSLIEKQENYLDMEMRRLRERYSVIHTRRDLIKIGMTADISEIQVCDKEEKAIILGPRNEFKPEEGFYESFMKFCRQAIDMRINLIYPIGGYHEDPESFFKSPGEPTHFFSLDPTGSTKRQEGKYMVGYYRGYYGQLGDLAERMTDCAEKNSLVFTGPVYTVYLHDETCVKDPSQYLSQVCVAVSKKPKS